MINLKVGEEKMKISIKEKVSLNGFKQKIHIWGTNPDNKILLFLHGGPGVSNRHSIKKYHLDLTDEFIVVAWDQRGTGGSYSGVNPDTLTLDQLVEDGFALVNYLCDKFHQEKVYLVGGSWGTELGTFLAYRHPEKIGGYIGYGQVVNGIENENRSYKYTLEEATKANDQEAVDTLNRVGPPVNGQYKPVFEGLMAQRKIMVKYGGHSINNESYFKGTVLPILLSTEYNLLDKYGMIKGYKLCLSKMWPTLVNYDFAKDYHDFKVPYYIFQGVHDNNTPSSLVQGFYDVITAPKKDLIWFENSAHGVLGEEPVKFKTLLREKFKD